MGLLWNDNLNYTFLAAQHPFSCFLSSPKPLNLIVDKSNRHKLVLYQVLVQFPTYLLSSKPLGGVLFSHDNKSTRVTNGKKWARGCTQTERNQYHTKKEMIHSTSCIVGGFNLKVFFYLFVSSHPTHLWALFFIRTSSKSAAILDWTMGWLSSRRSSLKTCRNRL